MMESPTNTEDGTPLSEVAKEPSPEQAPLATWRLFSSFVKQYEADRDFWQSVAKRVSSLEARVQTLEEEVHAGVHAAPFAPAIERLPPMRARMDTHDSIRAIATETSQQTTKIDKVASETAAQTTMLTKVVDSVTQGPNKQSLANFLGLVLAGCILALAQAAGSCHALKGPPIQVLPVPSSSAPSPK